MKLMETLSVQKAKQVLKDNSNLENDEQIKIVKELVFHENTEIAVTALKILGKLKDKENVNFI